VWYVWAVVQLVVLVDLWVLVLVEAEQVGWDIKIIFQSLPDKLILSLWAVAVQVLLQVQHLR
jgi:hypothetical protein